MRACVFVAVVCLGVLAVARAQQPQQPAPRQPTFRAGVSAVRVDVIVTDRQGTPADNLTAADFEVIEDGKPQTVSSFKLIRVQTRQEPGGEAPRAIRSFDDEETELARDDVRIIVILLDDYHVSRFGAVNLRSWLHRFVETQVGAYDLVALMYPMTPTAALTFTRDKYALTSVIDRFEGRRGDYMPRNQIEANYANDQPWQIEKIRSEVVGSAIKSVCYHLGSLNEGRKSLIVVAESLFLGSNVVREAIEAANRNNVAIYPLDPRMGGPLSASDAPRELADNTNGRAITERTDLDTGLSVVLRDSSAYYLLGYNSDKGADGKFHEIKVRVKKPGLEVRARKGYWAPTAAEAARALEPEKPPAPPEVTEALAALAQPRGRLVHAWIGMAPGQNGTTRVTFVWEPAAPVLGAQPASRVVRINLKASGPSGKPYFEGPVPAGSLPMPARAVFEAPAGRLQLRVSAEDERGQVVDTDVRDIDVPAFDAQRVAITTPSIFRSRTAKEFRDVHSDPDATPTADREFTRTERLLVRFDVLPAGASAAVSAQLLNRFGREMAKLSPVAEPNRPASHAIDLPLAGLVAGDYVIEIKAGDVTQMVAIRVTG